MKVSPGERRQIENEMIFRRANEKVSTSIEKTNEHNIAEGNEDLVLDSDVTLHFVCECSDENCKQRVPIKLSKYRKLHLDRSIFVILPEHHVSAIEEIVATTDAYVVVRKKKSVSEPGKNLRSTPVKNV